MKWTGERVARLGFLIGIGWDATRIGEDPIIACSHNNVVRQAQRFGLCFRNTAIISHLHPSAATFLDEAAKERGMTREALIKLVLLVLSREPNLLENVLDDQAA